MMHFDEAIPDFTIHIRKDEFAYMAVAFIFIKAHLAKFLAPSSLLRLIGSLVFNHRKCRVIDLILKVPIILFRQCLKISKSLFTGINCHNEMEKRIQLCFVFER